MVYKVCVILTTKSPEDMKEATHQIVISSCKGITYLVVSLSHPCMKNEDVEATRKTLETLASSINYSWKMECHQMRKNMIYVSLPSDVCTAPIHTSGSISACFQAAFKKTYEQMVEHYQLNLVDPIKNRKRSSKYRKSQSQVNEGYSSSAQGASKTPSFP